MLALCRAYSFINTQITRPVRTTHQASQSQMNTSSLFIVDARFRGVVPALTSGSTLRIGRSSGDLRPSHRTITLALLAVTRSTTPHRSVQSILPGRLLLLNAAAARAVSLTLSPRLTILSRPAERTARGSRSRRRITQQAKAREVRLGSWSGPEK